MDGIVNLNLQHNVRQKVFFLHRERNVLYGGAKGGGKSWAIRWKQVLRRLKYPGSRGLLIRREFPELRRTHIIKLQEELPYGSYTFNANRGEFLFPNGSVLEMSSAPHEASVMKYQGAEYDDIGIDEATEFTEYMYNILRIAARTKRTDIRPQIFLGANPGGVGHGWVKEKFITPKIVDPNNAFIPAKVYDNPVLMSADPKYIKQLQSLPGDLRRMYLEGDWDIFAGQAFDEFRRDRHVIDRVEYPLELCQKIIGFDWGYNAPGCAIWLAYTPDGRVYVYREIYQNKTTPEEWARQIREFTGAEKTEYIALPHDCFAKDRGDESIAEIFSRMIEIPVRRVATDRKGSRKFRTAILHQYLSDAPDGQAYLKFY